MGRCPRLLLALAALLAGASAYAQTGLGGERDTVAVAPGQTAVRLPAGVVPGSLGVEALRGDAFEALRAASFSVDDAAGVLRLAAAADSVVVLRLSFRRLTALPAAERPLPRLDSLLAREARARAGPGGDSARAGPTGPTFSAAGLRTTGSVTRGVVAGTARDVSVTSGLRLDVSGEVAPGVRLRAALTDENTPILPEGTTTQLSDLDRVFVEVESRRVRVRLGDVDLALRGTTFAPIARQVQGALAEAELPALGFLAGGRVVGSASATRGTYRSQDVVAVEGVQGPYRVQGLNGETFVVVVPGSERVTLDGQTLVRGESADYTIDYATGEITFTPLHLITAERRITVDFEYTTGGFTRTLTAAGADVRLWPDASGRARARLGVRRIAEGDAASFATDLGLSPDDLAAIAAAGPRDVLVPAETRVPFDAESPFVLYVRRDTLVGGQTVRIFVPATAADAGGEVFRVRFSRVTSGQGDYRRSGQARNGILYAYVGPGNGDAIAFRRLPRPSSRSLLDVSGAIEPVRGLELFGELARSVDDVNTLSSTAARAALASEMGVRLVPRRLGAGTVTAEAVRRARGDDFRTLDRVRDVEFNRRWNLARAGSPFGSVLDSLGEDVAEGFVAWSAENRGALRVEGGRLTIAGFRSDRLGASVSLGTVGGTAPGGLPWLDARVDVARTGGSGPLADTLGAGTFFRQHALVGRRVGAFVPSLGLDAEHRSQDRASGLGPDSGTLPAGSALSGSYAFVAVRPGVAFAARAVTADASVELRTEREPLGPPGSVGPLQPSAQAVTAEANVAVRSRGSTSGALRVAARRKRVEDPFRLVGREDAESVALRLTARTAPFRRAIDVQTTYEALTERTPFLQETYVLVGPDLGQYVWRDGQGEPRAGEPDGIPQVDEFFPETTGLEGTYVRAFVPGEALFPTVGVGATLRLGLEPARLVPSGSTGVLPSVLRNVALRTVLDVREQTRETDVLSVLLLSPSVLQQRVGSGPDSSGTLSGRFRAEQEVVFFPGSTARGGRLAVDHLTTTTALAAGFETRLAQSARAEAYGRLGPRLTARIETVADRRRTLSESFASRRFDLRGLQAEPRLVWTPRDALALTLSAVVASRTDALAPASRPSGAFIVRVPAEARVTLAGRLSLAVRAEVASVRLRGDGGTGLALFELTDGRGPGISALWGATAQIGLTERLRGTVVYDARAPSGAPVVQTVRVQLSAVF